MKAVIFNPRVRSDYYDMIGDGLEFPLQLQKTYQSVPFLIGTEHLKIYEGDNLIGAFPKDWFEEI